MPVPGLAHAWDCSLRIVSRGFAFINAGAARDARRARRFPAPLPSFPRKRERNPPLETRSPRPQEGALRAW